MATKIISKNNIVKLFRDFANAHEQLKDFGYGQVEETGTGRAMLYPFLWMTSDGVSVYNYNKNNSVIIPRYSFSFMIMDIHNNQTFVENKNGMDSDNGLEIVSDMEQIGRDLLTYIKDYLKEYDVSLVEGSINFEELLNVTPDNISGTRLSLQLETDYVNCSIPGINSFLGESSCAPAFLRNSNLSLNTQIPSGNLLTLSDITVSTKFTDLTFPAAVDIDMSDYILEGGVATINANGELVDTVDVGDTLNLNIVYENDDVVPISITGSNIIVPDVVVLPSNLIYIRPEPTGEVYISGSSSFPDGCDSWRVHVGLDISTQPTMGIPMLVDKTKRYKTIPNNTFGHKFRFTGKTGGYYDVETSQYKNASGAVVDYATSFPDNYLIDHSTGLGWETVANITNVTWQTALTEIDALTFAGFSDWFLPNLNELISVADYGYNATLGSTGDVNPIWNAAITNGTKWTATTRKGVETRAWVVGTDAGVYTGFLKTQAMRYMACRYHFNNIA